jgi:hypothetical protein
LHRGLGRRREERRAGEEHLPFSEKPSPRVVAEVEPACH